MTVLSSFSFKVVDCVSVVTEFCGLSFHLKVLLCFAAGTTGLLIQAKLRLTQTAGAMCSEKHHSGDAAFNLEFVLWPRVEPAHFTFTSPPTPPLLRERRLERWTSNTMFLKDCTPFSRPTLFFDPGWSRRRCCSVGHYFPSAVVPPTLSRGSLPQPAPAEGDARRSLNHASGWGGGVVLAAARWQ